MRCWPYFCHFMRWSQNLCIGQYAIINFKIHMVNCLVFTPFFVVAIGNMCFSFGFDDPAEKWKFEISLQDRVMWVCLLCGNTFWAEKRFSNQLSFIKLYVDYYHISSSLTSICSNKWECQQKSSGITTK